MLLVLSLCVGVECVYVEKVLVIVCIANDGYDAILWKQ